MKFKLTDQDRLYLKKSMYILDSIVKKNIRAQYRNSVLGILWTVLNPLLNMIVMALVFSQLFGRHMNGMDYPIYVLAGNTVFNLMRMATSSSLTCMVDNYEMLTKVKVPYYVFPTSHLLSATINFFFSLIALILVMLIRIPAGVTFHWSMLMIVFPYLPSLMLFSLGLGLTLCTFYVRFRDIKHFYGVILTLWTYLTPLFYPITILPENMIKFMNLNPMYHYVQYFRDIINGVVPSIKELCILYGFAIVMFVIGFLIFRSKKKKFILYI